MKTQTKIFQKKINRTAIGTRINEEAHALALVIGDLRQIGASLSSSSATPSPVYNLALGKLVDDTTLIWDRLKTIFSEMNSIEIAVVPVKTRKKKMKLTKVTKTNQKIKPAPTKVLKKGKS